MKPESLRILLEQIRGGGISVEEAMEDLARLPFRDIGSAVVDHHRALRTGFPETVFGESKTADQIISIARELATSGQNVLITRVSPEKAAEVQSQLRSFVYEEQARVLVLRQCDVLERGTGMISIVTAGTSDLPVAHEAMLVAELSGNRVRLINDVGVAGVHRLFHRLAELRESTVIVVVAGMEGALPSVVAGLVSCPVIAVPVSVGYGVSRGGFTALFGMLSSCAPGITVVNIDNGYGAGYAASLINRIGTGAVLSQP